MSDTIQSSVDHARASADVLADPDDIENQAILGWMRHHVAFRHNHHSYVLGTEILPLRWQNRRLMVPTVQHGQALLRPLKRDRIAMIGLRSAFTRFGPAACATDDGIIDLMSDALANRKAWIFEDARSPPIATKADPSVYTAINGSMGTNVDFAALGRWEGGQYLRGYVPFVKKTGLVAGASGMTIATGFDIGQRSEIALSKLDLPAAVGPKLAPFAGLRFKGKNRKQVAALVAARGSVPVLTKQEADAVDTLIHKEHLTAAVASWNARRKPGVPEFKALPVAWQTVLFSRTFHQGTGMPDTSQAKTFYTAATAGKWADAVTALQNYPVSEDWYKQRVGQEAAMLRTQMPPAVVVPPKAGVPGAPKVPGLP